MSIKYCDTCKQLLEKADLNIYLYCVDCEIFSPRYQSQATLLGWLFKHDGHRIKVHIGEIDDVTG